MELEVAAAEGRFEEEGWRGARTARRTGATWSSPRCATTPGGCWATRKVVRDLTERNRVEAELIRAKVAAERASEAKSHFLANMSHELARRSTAC